MSANISKFKLARFLLDAKRHSYAGLDDNAAILTPLLKGSKQLEWKAKDWFYRDVYYGMSLFTGMEVVYYRGKPIWSMSYSGGTQPNVNAEETKIIYTFLRSALMKASVAFPVRGPATFSKKNLLYIMTSHGILESFWGQEEVSANGICRYSLTFAGGLIR